MTADKLTICELEAALDIAAGRLLWLAKNTDDPRADVTFRWAGEAKSALAKVRTPHHPDEGARS